MALAPRIDSIQSGQNLAINGAMDFFQRGTSINFAGSRLYSADRFCHVRSGGYSGNSNASRSTDVPTLAQSGYAFSYSLLVTNGTGLASPAASDFHLPIQYIMEGYDYALIHGKTTRYQFWIKASIAGTYSVAFRNAAGNRSYVTTVSVTAANTWQLKTIDMTMDTAGTWNFDNTGGVFITIAGAVGSTFQTSNLNTWQNGNFFGATTQTNWAGTTSATIQITGFMIVQGSFSSDAVLTFRRAGRTISDELAMCQRYCPAYYFNSVSGPFGQFRNTTDGSIQIPFMVSARAVPTSISLVGGGTYLATVSNGSTTSISNPTFNSANLQGCKVDFTGGTGGTSGGASQLVNTTAGAAIIFEGAEL